MTLCGGSYPASQSEHLIAHYLDMLGQDLPLAYHGEHIAVTTITVARLQERVARSARLPATDLLDLLEAGDALRRPERFERLLLACEARGTAPQALSPA